MFHILIQNIIERVRFGRDDSKHRLLILNSICFIVCVTLNLIQLGRKWSPIHLTINGLVTPHDQYEKLGASPEERQQNYMEQFKIALNQKIIDEIRHTLRTSCVLGDSKFKSSLEQLLGRKVEVGSKGGDRKSKSFMERLGDHHNQLL